MDFSHPMRNKKTASRNLHTACRLCGDIFVLGSLVFEPLAAFNFRRQAKMPPAGRAAPATWGPHKA